MLGGQQVGDLSPGGRDSRAADLRRGAFADTVEDELQAVFGELVDLLAAGRVVVVEGCFGAHGFDELFVIVSATCGRENLDGEVVLTSKLRGLQVVTTL